MKSGIMQSYFFPYPGYFQLIASVDKFMLYEHVSFRKKSWMTRNFIRPANQQISPITIAVKNKSSECLIRDIQIQHDDNWEKKMLKKFHHGYKKAAYFDETYQLLENIFAARTDSLHDFNSEAVIAICKHLGINTTITYRHPEYLALEEMLANKFNQIPDTETDEQADRKHERIILICHAEGAEEYINPPGGKNMYSKEIFARAGIKLSFIQPQLPVYKQFTDQFEPGLSIIDVLMHCGAMNTNEMLANYTFE